MAIGGMVRIMARQARDLTNQPMAPAETARRLAAMREALDLRKSEIADQLGINRTSWSRFEAGERPLTLEAAAKICMHFPVTMDYLVLGRVHTLSEDMAAKIRPLLSR